MVFVLDNYDSSTYNLVQYLGPSQNVRTITTAPEVDAGPAETEMGRTVVAFAGHAQQGHVRAQLFGDRLLAVVVSH